jgi:hypothetical protein
LVKLLFFHYLGGGIIDLEKNMAEILNEVEMFIFV